MKLGIFNNQEFYSDGIRHSTSVSFYKFVESFLDYFEDIIVFAPTKIIDPGEHSFYKCSEKITLCQLPYYSNMVDLYKRFPILCRDTARKIKEHLPRCDVAWLVQPHPLHWLIYKLVNRAGVPAFLHIRGNVLIDVETRYHGLKYAAAKIVALFSHYNNIVLSRRIPTFVVGNELYDLYRHRAKSIFNISPSLVREDSINLAKSSRLNESLIDYDEITLLFVGRVEPEKGLEYLFNAVRKLNSSGITTFRLVIVGGAQRGAGDKESRIRHSVRDYGIEQYISWEGYLPYGEKLFDHYRNADIFILPSLSEGIPKVLYEAMSFGLPIVATDVGGVTDVVTHGKNGILVPPRSANAIVNAVLDLVKSCELRNSFIQEGFKVAKERTMEKARDKIIRLVIEPLLRETKAI